MGTRVSAFQGGLEQRAKWSAQSTMLAVFAEIMDTVILRTPRRRSAIVMRMLQQGTGLVVTVPRVRTPMWVQPVLYNALKV